MATLARLVPDAHLTRVDPTDDAFRVLRTDHEGAGWVSRYELHPTNAGMALVECTPAAPTPIGALDRITTSSALAALRAAVVTRPSAAREALHRLARHSDTTQVATAIDRFRRTSDPALAAALLDGLAQAKKPADRGVGTTCWSTARRQAGPIHRALGALPCRGRGVRGARPRAGRVTAGPRPSTSTRGGFG